MISLLKTITNTKLQLLGFRVSFLTYYSSREQFSTNLTFLGAQNLIGWAPEITGFKRRFGSRDFPTEDDDYAPPPWSNQG